MTTILTYSQTTSPFPLQASPSGGLDLRKSASRCSRAGAHKETEREADGAPPAGSDSPQDAPEHGGNLRDASVAILTVVASNPNPSTPVTLQGVSITLPVGPDAADLTADATGVGPVAPAGWSLTNTKTGSGSVEYVFTPQSGHGSVGGDGLAFTFNNITVNTQPGVCQIVVKEGSAGNPTTQLPLTKFPNGWGTVSFWVNPTNVPFGGSATLNWSGPSGATYEIQYALDGAEVNVPPPPLGPQGQYPAQGADPLVLDLTTVFTLGVSEVINEQSYEAQLQKTVTVMTPQRVQIVDFNSSAAEFGAGQVITLSWLLLLAANCQLSVDGGSGSVNVSAVNGVINTCKVISTDAATLTVTNRDGSPAGSLTLPSPLPGHVVFRLTAGGSDGSFTQQTFLVRTLTAWVTLQRGGCFRAGIDVFSCNLSWNSTNAVNLLLSNVGGVGASGNSLQYCGMGTFTLSGNGFGGTQTSSVTI